MIYRMVRDITGNSDPFRELKRESTQQALMLYPSLKKTIDESHDSLWTAIRFAITGNMIDFGADKFWLLNIERGSGAEWYDNKESRVRGIGI